MGTRKVTEPVIKTETVIEALDAAAADLDPAIANRLVALRHAAVDIARGQPTLLAQPTAVAAGVGTLLFRQRFLPVAAWGTLLLLILGGVWLAQRATPLGPLETDALLLSSDLPPEAYVDRGFDAWLNQQEQP